jgi:ATP-dependent helicase Lhr and Lhr-like helicase
VNVLGIGSLVGFAGRRWRVEAVDDRSKVLDVVPHRSGKLPRFDRPANEALHDRVVETMRRVLEDDDVPPYLDREARAFLQQGRSAYRALRLDRAQVVSSKADTLVVTWRGTEVNAILAILLAGAGLGTETNDIGLGVVDTTPEELRAVLSGLAECPPIADLAGFVGNLRSAKLDEFVDEGLLRRLWSDRNARHRGAVSAVLRELASGGG